MVARNCRRRRSRKECEDEARSSPLLKWFSDITEVLERPIIAITLFVLGVIFIVLASKQVKLVFDYMELFGVGERPREGFLGNFMAIFVFLFVWIDMLLLAWLRKTAVFVVTAVHKWYIKIMEALEDIEAKELEALKFGRKRRVAT